MNRGRYCASQAANIIRSWLGEESVDDDSYTTSSEASDDEVDNFLTKMQQK